ncbi:Zinc finger protein, partial [Phytophthora palmivora]
MTPTPTTVEPRFWCHECSAAVDTRVDEPSEEVCCVQCGGNFVEEIEEDDPPQNFQVEQVEDTQTQTQRPPVPAESNEQAENRNEFGHLRLERHDFQLQMKDEMDIRRCLRRSTRFMSSSGNPVEFYVSESGEGGDPMGILDALGGMFPMMTGNPGDYAFGNMTNVINQLMQNDPNRHGAPPASKDVVEKLPKVKITQS